jgi:putative ABC transport system substrate-binding protein
VWKLKNCCEATTRNCRPRNRFTKELLPGLKRLCLLFDGRRERNLVDYADDEFRAMAHGIGVNVCTIPIRTLDDIRAMPAIIDRERPQAVIIWNSPFMFQNSRTLIGALAHRLPVFDDIHNSAAAGAVLTYSVDWLDMFRRSAAYVDKILRGSKPGDLPIEQPTKFTLVVNLKAAKALGIRVPESILLRADEIIR